MIKETMIEMYDNEIDKLQKAYDRTEDISRYYKIKSGFNAEIAALGHMIDAIKELKGKIRND